MHVATLAAGVLRDAQWPKLSSLAWPAIDAAGWPWTCAYLPDVGSAAAEIEMSDNPKERARVNVNDPAERAYWCQKFGCSETQLRNAVKMVGVTPSKVRAQLAQLK